MSSLYQTTDGVTVKLENNIVVGPESKFHGKEVKTNQDIMEVFGINVMKQPKSSGGTEDTMILPDGTVVPRKKGPLINMFEPQEKMLPTIRPNEGGQILPDGTRLPSTDPRYGKFPGQRLNPVRPNMGQMTGSISEMNLYPTATPASSTYGKQKTKPLDLRRLLKQNFLANFTGLI
tara:strand:- start:31 stop:558 length:528 start_codon:yes stop_codon:yes gene_type:complete